MFHSVTLIHLEAVLFSTNIVEIAWALRKSCVLFGAERCSQSQRWGSEGKASPAFPTSPSLVTRVTPTHTTFTQVIHGSLHGFEIKETSHALKEIGFFVYDGKWWVLTDFLSIILGHYPSSLLVFLPLLPLYTKFWFVFRPNGTVDVHYAQEVGSMLCEPNKQTLKNIWDDGWMSWPHVRRRLLALRFVFLPVPQQQDCLRESLQGAGQHLTFLDACGTSSIIFRDTNELIRRVEKQGPCAGLVASQMSRVQEKVTGIVAKL